MDRIGSVANMSMAVAYTASSADIFVAVPPTRVDQAGEEGRGRVPAVASQVVWYVKPNKLISSYLITHAWQCYQAPTDWSLRMNSGGYVQVISSPLSIRRLASSTGTGGNAC